MSAPLTGARVPGVTYRQLDYWARAGYVRPDRNGHGSGVAREWSALELQIAELIARLLRAGFTLPAAAPIARDAATADARTHYAHLGDGVYLSLVLEL